MKRKRIKRRNIEFVCNSSYLKKNTNESLYVCTNNNIFETVKINKYENYKEIQEKTNSNTSASI
jgi:hypothetical protein